MADRTRVRFFAGLAALAALLGAILFVWLLTGESRPRDLSDKLLNPDELTQAIMTNFAITNRDAGGYLSSNGPWNYRFPSDYGPHGDFRSEVWSAYAVLRDADGQTFATHLSFLRFAIRDHGTPLESTEQTKWTTRDMMQGAFVLSDATGTINQTIYRLNRVALSLAGTQSDPASVWINNWQLNANPSTRCNVDMTMKAGGTDVGVDLQLTSSDCPSVSNEDSRQLPFHAYLLAPLSVSGTLITHKVARSVTGTAWMERAWGDLPFPAGVIVTDRLWLVARTALGPVLVGTFIDRQREDPSSYTASVLVVNPDGTQRAYTNKNVDLTINTPEINPDGIAPSGYSIEVTSIGLKLTIDVPSTDDRGARSAGAAYVGAVQFSGVMSTHAVAGVGIGNIAPYAKHNADSGS